MQDMIKVLLKIEKPLNRRLSGPPTRTFFTGEQPNSFTLFRGAQNELQVTAVQSGQAYNLAGYFCKARDGSIQVTLVHHSGAVRYIMVRPESGHSVWISEINAQGRTVSPTAKYTLDDARGTR
jgi:hypothetical protein